MRYPPSALVDVSPTARPRRRKTILTPGKGERHGCSCCFEQPGPRVTRPWTTPVWLVRLAVLAPAGAATARKSATTATCLTAIPRYPERAETTHSRDHEAGPDSRGIRPCLYDRGKRR